MSKKHAKTLVKVAISLGLILFLLSRIDIPALAQNLARANPRRLAATIFLFAFSILLRAWRWRRLKI